MPPNHSLQPTRLRRAVMKSTFNFMKPFYMLATLISFSLGPWRHIVAMLLLLCVSRAAYTDQQVGIVGHYLSDLGSSVNSALPSFEGRHTSRRMPR